jgi:hypothetical protein
MGGSRPFSMVFGSTGSVSVVHLSYLNILF